MGAGRSLESGSCGSFVDCIWLGLTQGRIEALGMSESTGGVLTGNAAGQLIARDVAPAALFLLVALFTYIRWIKSLRILLGFLVFSDLLGMLVLNKPAVFGPAAFAVFALLFLLSFLLSSKHRVSKDTQQVDGAGA